MKTIKTDPGAKRLMESLRNMGYDSNTAIADIVDNSIAADASEIWIDIIPRQDTRMDRIPEQHYHPAAILIADNGKGMDRDELHEAMRFGTLQNYTLSDLGKYGLGLKTASLSQCRILTVSSKARSASGVRPRRHCMRWDVNHVYETNDWNLLVPDDNELHPWEKQLLDQDVSAENGTVVLWTGLDGSLSFLNSNNVHEREKFLAHLIEEIKGHLRMVFHRYMQGAVTGRRKLNIYLCSEPLTPWDPFCRNEKTDELDILRLPVTVEEADGSKIEDVITISPFVLPREDEFSTQQAWKDASGPKNWNQQQGFYFYRNNRLLQAGGWSRLRTVDEHTKLLRVAIDFPGELDKLFTINITKMRASIPAIIREKIEASVSIWVKAARTRYDNPKPKEFPDDTLGQNGSSEFTTSPSFNNNSGTVLQQSPAIPVEKKLPPEYEIIEILRSKEGGWELNRFCEAMVTLLEAVYERRISAGQIPLALIKKIYKSL